jgi:hypothetical protein
MTTTRMTHVCVCIEGALKQRSITWIEDDDGNPLSTKAAKRFLRGELAKGKKYLTSGDCDNVSPEGRCLGHEVEEAIAS